MENSLVPLLPGLPREAYQEAPRFRMSGIELMVSTLLMVVGHPAGAQGNSASAQAFSDGGVPAYAGIQLRLMGAAAKQG
jgi:hypothetical protein